MESRSTMVRYFSLVSLLSISCISFAGETVHAMNLEKAKKSASTVTPYAIAATAGAVSGIAGTMAYTNRAWIKALIEERSIAQRSKALNAALADLKSLRPEGTVVASEVSPVVPAEAAPSAVTPGRFTGITTSASNLIASAQSGFVSGLASAKAGMASGLTSVGNGFISAKNTVSAFGSKQLENAAYYGHKALTGSKDCGNAVLAAVINNPKTSGAVVVAGTAAVALAVYHRKAIADKAGKFYTGTRNLLVNNAAYFGPLAAVLTVEAGKALLNSNFLACNSAVATADFSKQA